MEVKNANGTIAIPKHIKIKAVEKKRSENMTWPKVSEWIYKEYGLNISPMHLNSDISVWYDNLKENRIMGADKSNSTSPNWTVYEEKLFLECVEAGLTRKQIGEFMADTPELTLRNYSDRAITCKLSRMNIRLSNTDKFLHGVNLELQQKAKERCEELIADKPMTILKYTNANCIILQCDNCGHTWNSLSVNLLHGRGCPTCILPPNSYHEVYLIEFPNFGNASVKTGISVDYWNSRKKSFPKHTTVEVYETTFKKAKEIETLIAEKFGEYRTTPPELHNNGSTECYDISQTEKINKTIKEQLYG